SALELLRHRFAAQDIRAQAAGQGDCRKEQKSEERECRAHRTSPFVPKRERSIRKAGMQEGRKRRRSELFCCLASSCLPAFLMKILSRIRFKLEQLLRV